MIAALASIATSQAHAPPPQYMPMARMLCTIVIGISGPTTQCIPPMIEHKEITL